MQKAIVKPERLDEEWVELILAALNAGISTETIRDFLNIHKRIKH
ncbi:anti-repressor SinI family protein [Bacillus sp. FJAT-49732]|uniref:Anti-repressor SinI family protein n=1 Tax=Lederbergia citrisecunda TaxID=2833583 RepID=A0A942TL11_9BACI|nr:anti-repressor SinI family protein [Lederbergia citrisecunda]MBS4199570.1 anti-repressor SinI family protein [Lederbergia citrisecunda]